MPMPERRWDEIAAATEEWLRSGPIVSLEHVGWHALVAHEAPRHAVRSVPVQVDVLVQEILEQPGARPQVRLVPLTADDRERSYEDMADYLHHMGVSRPPRDREWRIKLPASETEDRFWEVLNATVAPYLDEVFRQGPMTGVKAGADLRLAVRERLALLL